WSYAFCELHYAELQVFWTKSLDRQGAQALNPEAVKSWFNLVKEHIVDKDILPENIYGMDESGFVTSDTGKQRVVGRQG
ncbi:hypothetical protein B0H17DRAFT_840293, partial [Mycena rosella]